MLMQLWKRQRKGGRPFKVEHRIRPWVETLEDRTVPSADAILDWNLVALDADKIDHTPGGADPGSGAFSQGGPTRSARALAITHVAMFDALNSITPNFTPYLVQIGGFTGASQQAAVATAAYTTLVNLYPLQAPRFVGLYNAYLAAIPDGTAENLGIQLGQQVGNAILANRANDHSTDPMPYTPVDLPGHHQPDPLHPTQGFLTPGWGNVTPFSITSSDAFLAPPPPALTSLQYTAAYYEVLLLGGDGVTTQTLRTPEQTTIGVFWGYDGSSGLGTPPRLYNQIVRVIAQNQHNTMAENARLFALVNIAMADAGIQTWDTKYTYDFWRPIIGIREGGSDGNPLTIGLPNWTPYGAPATNATSGSFPRNFTPPFPAYTSGHATFGASAFRTVARFYGTDNISFDFTSDEFNGVNKDQFGNVRPVVTRHYNSLSQAAEENGQSRIYLGIHWAFDKIQGIRSGNAIADFVFRNELRPVHSGGPGGPGHHQATDVVSALVDRGATTSRPLQVKSAVGRGVAQLAQIVSTWGQGGTTANAQVVAAKAALSQLDQFFQSWDKPDSGL